MDDFVSEDDLDVDELIDSFVNKPLHEILPVVPSEVPKNPEKKYFIIFNLS